MLYKGLLGRAKTPSVRPMRSKHTCAVNWVKGKWPRPCARHPLRSSDTHIDFEPGSCDHVGPLKFIASNEGFAPLQLENTLRSSNETKPSMHGIC